MLLTSHTYENGKNEQSHQDPSLCELMMGEPADVSRVVFPADANTAAAALEGCFKSRGQVWTLVVPKRDVSVHFSGPAAREAVKDGGLVLHADQGPKLVLTAIGGYQLGEVLRASERLGERGVAHQVVYLLEPRRFAQPRSRREEATCHPRTVLEAFYLDGARARLFVTHTRSGRISGLLQSVDTGAGTLALGYRNEGGTLNEGGMLFVNHQSWAHVLDAAGRLLGMERRQLLSPEEIEALDGRRSPHGLVLP